MAERRIPARRGAGGVQDMTTGSVRRVMVVFALPLLLSQTFQQLYNTADTFIVGKYLGTEALAAVGSSGPLIFLLISFVEGLSMGSGVVISRYFGARDRERVSYAVHTALALGLVASALLTVFGMLFTPTILQWIRVDPEVMPQAVEYFRYYFAGATAMVLYNVCRGIMTAVGDSRRPLYYLIFSSLLNVVLDLLFVAVFHWGVWSAAAATVISQAASMVLSLAHLMKKGSVITVTPRKLRFHAGMLREILRFGIPAGIQNSVIGIANLIVQSQINSFGKMAMAAYGAFAKVEGFVFLPITSFNMAVTTFVSQNLGAMKYDRAKKGARFGIAAAAVVAELIGVFFYCFAPRMIAVFDATPGVVAFGTLQARTIAPFYCLLAFSHSVAAVCRGAGRAVVPMFVMLGVWCVIRIIYIVIVMRLFGEIRYVFLAYPLTWIISSVIYLIYYHCSDWVHGFERGHHVEHIE